MKVRCSIVSLTAGALALLVLALAPTAGPAQEFKGKVKSVDVKAKKIVLSLGGHQHDIVVGIIPETAIIEEVHPAEGSHEKEKAQPLDIGALKPGDKIIVTNAVYATKIDVDHTPPPQRSILEEFWHNFRHNLFKPLLLFFYMGFLVPIFRVKFEFPYVIYQGLTIYLLIAIGWKGGEELAELDPSVLGSVAGFMGVGFVTNFFIGILAYLGLKTFTKLRQVDKATVAGYYGSDSAGTFVTCLGVLSTVGIAYGAYMPVMLAVMEIPGCLVALYLVSKLRHSGMDALGNMPYEPGYDPAAKPLVVADGHDHGHTQTRAEKAIESEAELSLEKTEHNINGNGNGNGKKRNGVFSPKLLHEVFLNPGLYLLFGGILIGFFSGLQGKEVTRADDNFFNDLFQGVLCLFLLEMGMTASRKLIDLKTAGIGYVAFGLIAPNIFATIGILVAHLYSMMTHTPFELGTYVLFAVLCGAASYIAVPAVQRLAIPEASPTLPLAASLGLTFSYNVTIGIPIYIEIAKAVLKYWH